MKPKQNMFEREKGTKGGGGKKAEALFTYRLLHVRIIRSISHALLWCMLMTMTMPMATMAVTMFDFSYYLLLLLLSIDCHFFLLCKLLQRVKAIPSHYNAFGQIADRCIFYTCFFLLIPRWGYFVWFLFE